jgi:glutaredoxin 3
MPQIQIFTVSACGFCFRAKALLDSKGTAYEEVNVSGDSEKRRDVQSKTGHRTFPQIFIDSTFIGGSDELRALDRAGRLDSMLA